MVTYTVQYVAESFHKDVDTSIMLRFCTYDIVTPHSESMYITIILGVTQQPPTQLTLTLDDDVSDTNLFNAARDLVMTAVLPIQVTACPICQAQAFYRNNQLLCLNMNCRSEDSSTGNLRQQLLQLYGVEFDVADRIIYYMNQFYYDNGITTPPKLSLQRIVRFMIEVRHGRIVLEHQLDIEISSLVDNFANKMTITNFFNLISVVSVVEGIEMIAVHFDDNLTALVADYLSDVSVISMLPINEANTPLALDIINVNLPLLDQSGILPVCRVMH